MAFNTLLTDTYMKYKEGTDEVTTWLADKAQSSNLWGDLFPKATDGQGKGRLKGKARAAKKDKPSAYKVHLSDIPRIAKAVATSKEEVPVAIVQTLEQVIAARRACNESFEQHGPKDTSTQTSNKSHQHFIEVLSETHHILQPLCKNYQNSSQGKGKGSDTGEKEVPAISNIFEHLSIEEPAEWTSNSLPVKTAKAFCTYELEIETSEEEASFAIFCLLKDLTDIRHFVRQTWAEYRERQIALTTAAVTTNTAIAVFRRLTEEFSTRFPRFEDHGALIDFLYTGYCDQNSKKTDDGGFAAYTGHNFKLSSKTFFCQRTFEVLVGFFMANKAPFYKAEGDLRVTPDEETLLKCLSLFGLLNATYQGELQGDLLIKGLHVMRKTGTVYTWVVFATQLFIDTRRVVGEELSRCFDETLQLHKAMSTIWEQTLQFGRTNFINDYYEVNGESIQKFKQRFEDILEKDFVQTLVHAQFGDRASQFSWGSFYLFRNHPLLVGLFAQDILRITHDLGVGLGGDQDVIMTTIHLYNLAHQAGEIPKSLEWTDLEKVIEWQDPSYIFVGDRPEDVFQCFRRFCLSVGYSATIMQRDKHGRPTFRMRNDKVPISQNKARRLKPMSKYMEVTVNRTPFRRSGQERWDTTRAATEPLVMLEMLVTRFLEDQAKKYKNRKSRTRDQTMHPLRMMSIFKDCLKSDEEKIRFDLVTLNQRCIELFRKIQILCVEQSPLDYPSDEFRGDLNLNRCIRKLMVGVDGGERQQPTRFPEASVKIKELIELEGASAIEQAKALCFVGGDGSKKVEDKFETPMEDDVPFWMRAMFSNIVMVGGQDGSDVRLL